MNEIGGFFELELNTEGNDFVPEGALAFNSGSSALLFFLLNTEFTNILVPYYTCKSVVDTVKKVTNNIIYYRLNEDFTPRLQADELGDNDLLIYNNYFGINEANVASVLLNFSSVIIDASQSFFYSPDANTNAFNSFRKFFGVPDGGMLFPRLDDQIKQKYKDLAKTKYEYKHLIERIEFSAQEAFESYKRNEKLIFSNGIGLMSQLTKVLMNNRDLNLVKIRRRSNFNKLHLVLKKINKFNITNGLGDSGPMCYPLLVSNGEYLKERLIAHRIYIPTYWPGIACNFHPNCEFELQLVENLVCLPVDQRYSHSEMDRILETIEIILNE